MSVKCLVLLAIISVIVDCEERTLANVISEVDYGTDGDHGVPSTNLLNSESGHTFDPETIDQIYRILRTHELTKIKEKEQRKGLNNSGEKTKSNESISPQHIGSKKNDEIKSGSNSSKSKMKNGQNVSEKELLSPSKGQTGSLSYTGNLTKSEETISPDHAKITKPGKSKSQSNSSKSKVKSGPISGGKESLSSPTAHTEQTYTKSKGTINSHSTSPTKPDKNKFLLNSSKSELKYDREQKPIRHPNDKNKDSVGKREKYPEYKAPHKDDDNRKLRNNNKPNSNYKSNALDQVEHSGIIEDLANYTMKVMAERDFDLLVNTNSFMTIFKEDYEALAEVEEDNNDWIKYIKSAMENFYLEFNKIYYHLGHTYVKGDDTNLYKKAYDLALYVFGERRNFNAVKMAAPVRRIADLIKSIIGGPIEMILTSCRKGMPTWQCNIAYLTKLIAAAESCPNIWSHSLVLETMLQYNRVLSAVIDPSITALGTSKVKGEESPPIYRTQTDDGFGIILHVLVDTVESAKKSLQLRANLYSLIIELQNSGKLNCTNLGTPLYVF